MRHLLLAQVQADLQAAALLGTLSLPLAVDTSHARDSVLITLQVNDTVAAWWRHCLNGDVNAYGS